MPAMLMRSISDFRGDGRGSVIQIFALVLAPLIWLGGAAVDYSRASARQVQLQSALDAAILAGAGAGGDQWISVATRVFESVLPPGGGEHAPTPTFSRSGDAFTGGVTESVRNSLLAVLGQSSVEIGAVSRGVLSPGLVDNSCILTLDQGQPSAHQGMTFNGAPNVALTGCTLRSNTSIRCNGHGTGTPASLAVGTSNCNNPQPNVKAVPDIHAALAQNIRTKCTSYPGATWIPGTLPTSPRMERSYDDPRVDIYHVCGTLTLSGSGALFGSTPTRDSLIVIENGGLTMDARADVQAFRTAIILTGDNSRPSTIEFPNGNGQGATLTISPPRNAGTWTGVSIYQNPALTNGVDADWGPGATMIVDGLVYLPRANVTMRGNSSAGSAGCSKFVFNTLRTNGSVDLKQTATGCASIGLRQSTEAASLRLSQ